MDNEKPGGIDIIKNKRRLLYERKEKDWDNKKK